jgi:hypothetical protein
VVRKAIVTALIVMAGCSAEPLRPTVFDPSKGTALLMLGPGADADRMAEGRRLTVVGLRDVSGTNVLPAARADQCTLAPIELNPGRYTVEVARCSSSCTGARFSFELDAQRGHDYRVEIDRALLALQLIVTEWEAFLTDETTDASRSVGKAVERCD